MTIGPTPALKTGDLPRVLASSATTNVPPGPPVSMIVHPPDDVDGDDAVLVARAGGGDGSAFEGLVQRH